MESVIVLSLLLIAFLIWEYKFSRVAKLFKAIKIEEPETYELLCKNSVLYPGLILKGIIANNQYNVIKSNALKQELLNIDEKDAKHSVMLLYVFVAYILINLLLKALANL